MSRSQRTEFLVNIDQIKGNAAIRVGAWKLYQGDPGGAGAWIPPPRGLQQSRDMYFVKQSRDIQLYNVLKDPEEREEVSLRHPVLVKILLEKLKGYRERALQPSNMDTDQAADPGKFGGVWTPWLETC